MSVEAIILTEAQHKELMAIMLHYSTRSDKWASSQGLRLAIAEPVHVHDIRPLRDLVRSSQ